MNFLSKLSRVARLAAVSAALASLAACATGGKARIVELENGKVAAIGTAKNEPDAVIAAVDSADSYCRDASEAGKKPVFKNDVAGSSQEKGARLNWKNLPVIGKAFEEKNPKVVMEFACK